MSGMAPMKPMPGAAGARPRPDDPTTETAWLAVNGGVDAVWVSP